MCRRQITRQVDRVIGAPRIEQQIEVCRTSERVSFEPVLLLSIDIELPLADRGRGRRLNQNLNRVAVLRVERAGPFGRVASTEIVLLQSGTGQCAMSVVRVLVVDEREDKAYHIVRIVRTIETQSQFERLTTSDDERRFRTNRIVSAHHFEPFSVMIASILIQAEINRPNTQWTGKICNL